LFGPQTAGRLHACCGRGISMRLRLPRQIFSISHSRYQLAASVTFVAPPPNALSQGVQGHCRHVDGSISVDQVRDAFEIDE
jgi:hypothetical protein